MSQAFQSWSLRFSFDLEEHIIGSLHFVKIENVIVITINARLCVKDAVDVSPSG